MPGEVRPSVMTLPANQGNQTKSGQVYNGCTSLDVKSPSPNVSPEGSPSPRSRSQQRGGGDGHPDTSPSPPTAAVPPSPDISLSKSEASCGSSDGASRGSGEGPRSTGQEVVRGGSGSGRDSRGKRKAPWYSALYPYPTYRSRCEDFKRIFVKDVPPDERLVVDYSCAIQKDILVHGRLYVSQNYLCFYANIFRWETQLVLAWKEVTALTKEKTALVIPNALLVHTSADKHFFTSFGARDKAYVMLFRVWQSALIDQPVGTVELLQWVRSCYGDDLGLSSDEEESLPSVACLLNSAATESQQANMEDSMMGVGEGKNDAGGSPPLDQGAVDSRNGSPSGAEPPAPGEADATLGAGPPDLPSAPALPPTTLAVPPHHPQPPDTPVSPESDLSDESSESESEKQGEVVTCPGDHAGRLVLHMHVSIHVDQLFTHLFTNSKFFSDLHHNRKTTDVKQSTWVHNPSTNQKDRTVSLTVMLAQAVGPKQAQVTETQRMLECSKPGEMYAIDIEACNAGVPYADSFFIWTHYCLTRGSDPNTSTLAVYCQIKYRKHVWVIVRNYIEKNCWSGLEDYFATLVRALEEECERTRRAVLAGASARGVRRRRPRRRDTPPLSPPPQLPAFPLQRIAIGEVKAAPLVSGGGGLVVATAPQATQSRHHDPLTWLTFLVLLSLLVINAALYYKLWGLEDRGRNLPPDHLSILRDSGAGSGGGPSEKEWRWVLRQQEELHSAEVERWLRVLRAAVHLLQQVEHSLTGLQATIQSMMTESMRKGLEETGEEL